jgi:hypothetical protein
MAKFRFNHFIDIHWNGYNIVGDAGTIFSIPDQLYEEFEEDLRPVEPSLEWTDTNEFQTLTNSVAASTITGVAPIVATSTSTGKQISISSATAPDGYVLTADGAGGAAFEYSSGGGGGGVAVVGTSPISVITADGTATVSLNANYQTAGTYVTSVSGTAPITTSGTTAITVGIDQAAITANSATNASVLRAYVKNSTGTTLNKGQVVYVSGADGANALISLSSASTEAGSSKTLGLLSQTLTTGQHGYVIENGLLVNIDTSAATAGQAVWLGNTPGSFVFGSPPAEPSHSVYLGVVTRVQSNNGEILVKVQNGYELDELHDVSAASPSDGDIIQYKTSSSLWTKSSVAGAGIAASVHTHDYQASGSYASSIHTHATSSITSGNFVATLAAGTGVTVTGADANAAAKTVSIGQAVATSSDVTFNNLKINGDNSFWVARASVASATQSLTNNTSTQILLDTASTTPTTGTYDPKSWFNNANDRIAVGQAGFYCVTANIAFAANATGRRTLTVAVNGADAGSVNVLAAPAGSTILSVSTNLYLAAGDLVTMTALQQSGGALNTAVVAGVYPALSLGRIGA